MHPEHCWANVWHAQDMYLITNSTRDDVTGCMMCVVISRGLLRALNLFRSRINETYFMDVHTCPVVRNLRLYTRMISQDTDSDDVRHCLSLELDSNQDTLLIRIYRYVAKNLKVPPLTYHQCTYSVKSALVLHPHAVTPELFIALMKSWNSYHDVHPIDSHLNVTYWYDMCKDQRIDVRLLIVDQLYFQRRWWWSRKFDSRIIT